MEVELINIKCAFTETHDHKYINLYEISTDCQNFGITHVLRFTVVCNLCLAKFKLLIHTRDIMKMLEKHYFNLIILLCC